MRITNIEGYYIIGMLTVVMRIISNQPIDDNHT